ncbi:MAG: hypothetical protein E7312_08665 [Clostridiales bacterium]|nr:hypothetical protein [Clostridiales bacterium]
MHEELILEKYVNDPVRLTLSDGLLCCKGVVIANDVEYFDAVTDTKGNVHGIYTDSQQRLIYFHNINRVPEAKIIAKRLCSDAQAFISEEDGVLHLLVVGGAISGQIDHFYTSGNNWQKSKSLLIGDKAYTSSCPCRDGCFAVLLSKDAEQTLWLVKNASWKKISNFNIDTKAECISLANRDDVIEIIYPDGDDMLMKEVNISENESFEEESMANGNMLNSKYIMQINENTKKLETHSEQIETLKTALAECDKISRQMMSVRESMKLYENQINQLNIRLQELVNRFNGIIRSASR